MYQQSQVLLVVLLAAALASCDAAAPLAPEGAPGKSAQTSLLNRTPTNAAEKRAQVVEFIGKLRHAMAQPDFRFGGQTSDGRNITAPEALSRWETILARLDAKASGKALAPPVASRAASSSSGPYVDGYTTAYVHRDAWCSDAVVGASSVSDQMLSWISVRSDVDYEVSLSFYDEWRTFTLYMFEYGTNSTDAVGSQGACTPEAVRGGYALTSHEGRDYQGQPGSRQSFAQF